MKRKLMAFALVFAMLASLSPAVAADEMSAPPTVEEILNEYHRKAFEAQTRGETDAASTWSRRGGSAKTLEQETVDALTAAGYEAYNVTADNYEALEAELKTDFAGMGLDPEGSYIIMIEGEGPGKTASANSRTPSPHPELDQDDTPGGYPATYTYNGITYSVRYVTVTSTDDNLVAEEAYHLKEKRIIHESWLEMGEFGLTTLIDAAVHLPIMSIASFIAEICNDSTVIPVESGDLVVHAKTTWTRYFIQVQDLQYGSWFNRQCSESAISVVHLSGLIRDLSTNEDRWFSGSKSQFMTYSPDYLEINDRLYYALVAHTHTNSISHDRANIPIYFDGENAVGDPYYRFLFTQYSPDL